LINLQLPPLFVKAFCGVRHGRRRSGGSAEHGQDMFRDADNAAVRAGASVDGVSVDQE